VKEGNTNKIKMGKLACQLCIAGAAIALLLQIVSIFQPILNIGTISLLGLVTRGQPLFSFDIYWNRMMITMPNVFAKDVMPGFIRHAGARVMKEREIDQRNAAERRQQHQRLSAADQEAVDKKKSELNVFEREWKAATKRDLVTKCCPGEIGHDLRQCRTHCMEVSLAELNTFWSNRLAHTAVPFMPELPGGVVGAPVMLYGGIFTMFFTVFAGIALLLGGGYLYYYSEVKATKQARKGATVAFTAAPVLGLLIVLCNLVIIFLAKNGSGGSFWFMAFFAATGTTTPKAGLLISTFNMLFLGMMLCFTRYWRMKRAEKVRQQRKDEEEEDEFMQLMGINRGDLDGGSEDESSEDESSSDEEDVDEEQPRQPMRPPAIVPSAPVAGQFIMPQTYTVPMGQQTYTTSYTVPVQPQVTTQRIVIDPNQQGTQRIYL
jgi:hypothetical protein